MTRLMNIFNSTKNNPPLIIAEISGNHNGNNVRFLNLIKKACKTELILSKLNYEVKI